MMTRWQEDALVARIRETKARLAEERATIDPATGGIVQPWAKFQMDKVGGWSNPCV